MKPLCSPANRDLCDEEQLAKIDKYVEMDKDVLEALIADGEKSIEGAEANFKSEVGKLQKKYCVLCDCVLLVCLCSVCLRTVCLCSFLFVCLCVV